MKSLVSSLLCCFSIILCPTDISAQNSAHIVNQKVKAKKKFKKLNKAYAKGQDTIYHKLADGKLSVKFAPKSERQKIWIYHPSGSLNYEVCNVNLSYHVSNVFYFRKDGSVDKIVTHMNPGASMYTYETETFFNQFNEPMYKLEHKNPSTLEETINNKWLWDVKRRSWVKQEIIIETNPIPK